MSEEVQFDFPMLDVKDIVSQLRNVGGISIEEIDFKRPDPNRWAKLYPQILESLTGVAFESMMLQNSLNASSLEHPELYEESLPPLILSLALSRVLKTCGVKDFTIADIHEPRSQRCIKIGSAVVNFILFKQHQIDVFKNLKEANKRSAKQFDHVVKMNDELKMKVYGIKATRAEEEPEIVKIQQDIQTRLVTMNEMEKVKNEKQKAISEVKATVAEKQASTEKVRVMILKTKEEIEKLSLKIVQSPERVKEDQENMKQKVVNMKSGLDQKWTLLEEMQQRLETVIQGTATMDKVLKLLIELQANIDSENQISTEINQIVDKCQEQRTTLTNLRARKDQLQQIIAGRMEKRDKLSLQHQNKIQSLSQSVDTLQQQKDLYQQRFDSHEVQRSELWKQQQQIINSINEDCLLWEKKKESIMNLYRQILERVDENHKDLGGGWEVLQSVMLKVLQQLGGK